MARLIKPSDYAKEYGISRQAVYAKIKKGLLKAKKVDGKIFIELDDSIIPPQKSVNSFIKESNQDLLAAKDETIAILKETINDLKKTNNLIVGTLKSEVELLKAAFSEMQQIYRTQIEHLRVKEPKQIENFSIAFKENDFMELKELAKELGIEDKRLFKRFKKAARTMQKQGDFRFVIINDEVYALKNADYSDFIEALKSL